MMNKPFKSSVGQFKGVALARTVGAVLLGLSALAAQAASVAGPGVAATGGASVTSCGSISGGLGWDGVTRARAVDFSGGGNTLTLENGASFTGLVVSAGGDTLALGGGATTHCGGAGNGSFDVTQIGPSGAFQGFTQFAKTGASTWTVTGSNPATNWAVNGGVLQVTGAVGAVTINAGSTVAGTGTAGPMMLQNGGFIAPGPVGNVPGALHGAGLTWNGGGAFNFQLGSNPSNSDLLALTGPLTKGSDGSYVFHFSSGPGGGPKLGTYTLINFGSSSGFVWTDFSFDFEYGLEGYFQLTDGQLQFVVTYVGIRPIPTLGEWALLMLGALLAGSAALGMGRRNA